MPPSARGSGRRFWHGSGAVPDGTVAELTQVAADALTATFGATAFKTGLPLGVVHLVATADNS